MRYPPLIFGKESRPRPTPYILSDEQICRIIQLAAQSGYRTLRRQTYSTLFALLACTGLRVSEAIRLRYDDITPDGVGDPGYQVPKEPTGPLASHGPRRSRSVLEA